MSAKVDLISLALYLVGELARAIDAFCVLSRAFCNKDQKDKAMLLLNGMIVICHRQVAIYGIETYFFIELLLLFLCLILFSLSLILRHKGE